MKRIRRSITASIPVIENVRFFTPVELLKVLSNIHELRECVITLKDGPDGTLDLTIDDRLYRLIDDGVSTFL